MRWLGSGFAPQLSGVREEKLLHHRRGEPGQGGEEEMRERREEEEEAEEEMFTLEVKGLMLCLAIMIKADNAIFQVRP